MWGHIGGTLLIILFLIVFFGQFVVVIKAMLTANAAAKVENKAYEAMVLSPSTGICFSEGIYA